MSTFKIYTFVGIKETYREVNRAVAGISFEHNGVEYGFGKAGTDGLTPVLLFSEVLSEAIAKIRTLKFDVPVERLIVVMSETSYAAEDEDLIMRLVRADGDYTSIEKSISENKTMNKTPTGEGLMSIARTLGSIEIDNIIIEGLSKPTEDDIKGMLRADAVANRGYYHNMNGKDGVFSDEVTGKVLRKRTNDISPLVVDNLIYNWRVDNTIDLKVGKGKLYFTGNCELQNKKPKGVATDPVASKGSVYFTGNAGRLRVLGRVNGNARYNVVILKEPVKYLDNVFNIQRDICKKLYTTEQMVVFRNDTIHSAGTSGKLEDGDLSDIGHTYTGDMYTTSTNRKELSYVFNPPRLSFKIRRILEENQVRLVDFISGDARTRGMGVTDVTDNFYKEVNGKLVLSPEFPVKATPIKFTGIESPNSDKLLKIKATPVLDFPSKIAMNKLVKSNPRVHMLTWALDEHILGFCFVISSDEGWLLYCSNYGSRHVLRTGSSKARAKLKGV